MQILLKFKPSQAEDVQYYNLYAAPSTSSEVLDKDNAEFVLNIGKPEVNEDGFMEVVLNDIPEIADLDGEYDFGVSAVDEAENESELLVSGLENINIDLMAPDAPTEGSITFLKN